MDLPIIAEDVVFEGVYLNYTINTMPRTYHEFISDGKPSDDRPKLKDVLKELLPLATEWKTIGILLGIQKHILDKIKKDEDGVCDCLQEMLAEWLKQVDPPSIWRNLADAVEHVDQKKAQELAKR